MDPHSPRKHLPRQPFLPRRSRALGAAPIVSAPERAAMNFAIPESRNAALRCISRSDRSGDPHPGAREHYHWLRAQESRAGLARNGALSVLFACSPMTVVGTVGGLTSARYNISARAARASLRRVLFGAGESFRRCTVSFEQRWSGRGL